MKKAIKLRWEFPGGQPVENVAESTGSIDFKSHPLGVNSNPSATVRVIQVFGYYVLPVEVDITFHFICSEILITADVSKLILISQKIQIPLVRLRRRRRFELKVKRSGSRPPTPGRKPPSIWRSGMRRLFDRPHRGKREGWPGRLFAVRSGKHAFIRGRVYQSNEREGT